MNARSRSIAPARFEAFEGILGSDINWLGRMPYDHLRLRYREVLLKRRRIPETNADPDHLEALSKGDQGPSLEEARSSSFLPFWLAWAGILLGAGIGFGLVRWYQVDGPRGANDVMAVVCSVVFAAGLLGYGGHWLGEVLARRIGRRRPG